MAPQTIICKVNILITGAAGFIGFHLARYLHERKDTVVGLDNFNSYYNPSLKRRRASLLSDLKIPIIEADIQNLSKLEEIVEKFQITHVVHLAAQAGVRYSKQNPQAYVDTNINGFLQILELIRKHPSIPLIYASSSSVYGLNSKTPFAETDRTDSPSNLYGATKKSNELMAHAYHHLFGVSAVGLRFFTVYGPWGRPDMAYFSFTEAILKGSPIKIFNQGKMERDFTYIDDITRGIVSAIDKGKGCEVFNLGNCKPEGVMSLVDLLEKKLGKKANIELAPKESGEVLITYADISKAQKELGFHPKVSLDEGLDAFLKWYNNSQEA